MKEGPRVALYVNKFLPYTQPWIYRQITFPANNVKLVLCHSREEETNYPFPNIVISPGPSKLKTYIRGRFWKIYKNISPSLSKKNVFDFKKALTENSIDLVHTHFGTNAVYISQICKSLNIPFIVTFHGFDLSSVPKRWPAYLKALQQLFKEIKFALAISEEMASRLIELGCPKEKVLVSYLGVPLEKFPFANRNGNEGPTRFLHAGRFTSKKGVPDLIKSFAKAFPTPGTAILDLAGDGEEKDLVLKTIQETEPANPVNLLGLLHYEELLKAMNRADVFVANSRTDSAGTKEGLPIAIIEAASTGLPVISTYHAGIPETIINNKTGILVPEYSNEELQEAMLQLNNRKVQLEYGSAGRKYMEEKFSLQNCNHRLSEIYRLSFLS